MTKAIAVTDISDLDLGRTCLGSLFGLTIDCLSAFYPPVAAARCLPAAILFAEQTPPTS